MRYLRPNTLCYMLALPLIEFQSHFGTYVPSEIINHTAVEHQPARKVGSWNPPEERELRLEHYTVQGTGNNSLCSHNYHCFNTVPSKPRCKKFHANMATLDTPTCSQSASFCYGAVWFLPRPHTFWRNSSYCPQRLKLLHPTPPSWLGNTLKICVSGAVENLRISIFLTFVHTVCLLHICAIHAISRIIVFGLVHLLSL